MTFVLIAALLAQENVTLVVKPAEKRSWIEKLAVAGRRLFEKEDPTAAAGNALEAQHKHEEALRKYDQVAAGLPEDSAAQAAVQLDRSSAILGFGSPEKAPEAASAAGRALQNGTAEVKAQGAYNLALALEQMGKADEALKMYQQALKLDPGDVDSKVNLELLLSTEEEKKQQQQMPGNPQDKKQPQQAKDQKQEQQKKDSEQQKQNRDKQQGDRKDEKNQQAQQQDQQDPRKADKDKKKEQEAQAQKPVDRSEAERLLDALRAGEKNLQAWRFAKEKRKDARRSDAEKDW